ncbi:MAG TPA: efflux RND transporter periplasmic adaptor subunit [Polyangiaceae bacterium LLY-WYZ-15_(1-7)]|nr:efflux RND transporter periplasmic adaptor subunit [Polyangiaceae bacterium LLY-WYZ-15_(1-7)]HJL12906.1 efflux RND transporter periplasmic adaptor subunit [Polyangiaceae bacterium LLY-WYZ-15_(1-7)]HJL36612.1 efflux RND transporter periplasmic adaptor subunit [Polyangiaceae bacterium LLY-WYZ-15_(1-7)]
MSANETPVEAARGAVAPTGGRWLALGLLAVAIACGSSAGGHDDEHGHEDGHDEHGHEEHGHEDGHPERAPGRVELTPAAAARLGLRVEEAGAASRLGGVEVPAEVQLDPDRTAHVASLVEGQVVEVRASIGDRVEAGDVLVVLRSVALGETRAGLAEARAEVEVATATLARQEALADAGVGAARHLERARADLARARARLQALQSRARVYGRGGAGPTTVLRSPLAGEVLMRHATVGEVVAPERVLFTVADLSEVWVMGRVFARDLAAAELGAEATLTLGSDPDARWSGALDYVAPALEERTRTLPIRVVLPNPDRHLRPGQFGTLRLPGEAPAAPWPTVEADAVQELFGGPVVFVPAEEEHAFRAVPVRLGPRAGGSVAIREGLSVGDRYVAAGAFTLKSEALAERLGGGHHH